MSREKKEKDELAQVVKAAKRRRFKKKFMLGLATLAALFFACLLYTSLEVVGSSPTTHPKIQWAIAKR